MRIDLFCQVVDNFGDAGVCWRLARQMVAEFAIGVRLWIDDPGCLHRVWPEIRPGLQAQTCAGVEVCRWPCDFPEVEPCDVVIEAFGCALPRSYVAAMAEKPVAPLWINLEYLSAEPWVEGCHALPSPHPRLPLTKHFFFPGFSSLTGGLLREAGLSDRRNQFRADPANRTAFLYKLGVGSGQGERKTLLVSLFCYDNPGLKDLIAAWAGGERDVLCLVPEGSKPGVLAALGLAGRIGDEVAHGRLRARVIPFLDQDGYDRLLWSCDLNFVRGEDSFLRAQWAARPFVWQAYPQSDEVHHAKVAAFLSIYLASAVGGAARAASEAFECWNGARPADDAWTRFFGALPTLERHAIDWDRRLAAMPSLAANLASYCHSKLKSAV